MVLNEESGMIEYTARLCSEFKSDGRLRLCCGGEYMDFKAGKCREPLLTE